jgi:hypothetical protein
MNDEEIVARLVERVREQDDAHKIKAAFQCLTDAAVLLLLRGLRAEGLDVDAWLNEQAIPRKGSKEAAIHRLITEGRGPKVIGWKAFYDLVRDECGGWGKVRGKRRPAHGFNDRTIRRGVRAVELPPLKDI